MWPDRCQTLDLWHGSDVLLTRLRSPALSHAFASLSQFLIIRTLSFASQTVQKELESKYTKCRNLERQVDQLEADHEEKITHLKLSYEEKMRGLMPGSIRQVC